MSTHYFPSILPGASMLHVSYLTDHAKLKKKDLSSYEQQNKLQFEERGQGGAAPRGQALFEFGIILLAAVWFHCAANATKYEV